MQRKRAISVVVTVLFGLFGIAAGAAPVVYPNTGNPILAVSALGCVVCVIVLIALHHLPDHLFSRASDVAEDRKLVPIWQAMDTVGKQIGTGVHIENDDVEAWFVGLNRTAYGIRQLAEAGHIQVLGRQNAWDLLLPIEPSFWRSNQLRLTSTIEESGMNSRQTEPTGDSNKAADRYTNLHLRWSDVQRVIAEARSNAGFGKR